MKLSLLVASVIAFTSQTHAAPYKWTTAALDLQCQGQIIVMQVGPIEHKTMWLSTRNPEPQPFPYTLAPVKMKFVNASKGCLQAQNLFDLPFAVQAGGELQATISQYGHVTQEQMLKFADLNTSSSFQIKQKFYTATESGELPVFPLYHVESIEFLIQAKIPQHQIGIPLDNEPESNLQNGAYFSNYKFLEMEDDYGIPSPNNMSVSEKYETVKDIVKLSQASNLSNPQVVKIVYSAISAFAPNQYSDFNEDKSLFLPALKKHLDLVVPFINQHLLPFANGSLPKDISSIYQSIQQELNFSLFPPFSTDPEDSKYAIYTLVKMPTTIVVSTGNAFNLTAQEVEQFLTLSKNVVLAYVNGSPIEADLAPYVSMEKTFQINEAARYMLQLQHQPGQSWQFPLTEKSKKLIEEILAWTH